MYCDKCGYNNNNTAVHCLGCGAPLRSDVDKESSNKKKKSKPSGVSKIWLTFSIVIILIGLLQMSCIFNTYLARYGWRGYKKAHATLEKIEDDSLYFLNEKYNLNIKYKGRDYRYTLECDFGDYRYSDGQTIEVYFNPNYPDDIVEVKKSENLLFNTARIGLIIFIIGCLLLIKPIMQLLAILKQNRTQKKLLTTGYGIRCIIKDITHEYITGGNVVGSKIICTDVNTGKIYESALIKQDLMWLQPGMEVGVMVDRANPDNYWVLTPKPNTYKPYTQNGGLYN